MHLDTSITFITVSISSDRLISTTDFGLETFEISIECSNQTAKGRKKKAAKRRRSDLKRDLLLWRWYQRLGHLNTVDVK